MVQQDGQENDQTQQQQQKKRRVRHLEKRRTGTCRFADRIAAKSLEAYHRSVVVEADVETGHDKQGTTTTTTTTGASWPTCVATILAHFADDGYLQVMGLGVGTKFLTEAVLHQEQATATQTAPITMLASFQDDDDANNEKTEERAGATTCTSVTRSSQHCYGGRVRDCHAEVLARRAFRRQVSLEILKLQSSRNDHDETGRYDSIGDGNSYYRPILRPIVHNKHDTSSRNAPQLALADGVTLHMYTSSAPCGNATLKKFAKMQKETFHDCLGDNEWPSSSTTSATTASSSASAFRHHEPVQTHSLHLGQCALLVKRDASTSMAACVTAAEDNKQEQELAVSVMDSTTVNSQQNEDNHGNETTARADVLRRRLLLPHLVDKERAWQAFSNDKWCPPGTTIVTNYGQGSLHSCSDKICRWNCLGLQGSLLASMLVAPLYLSTLTVGRKLTASICQRAVCCRAAVGSGKSSCGSKRKQQQESTCSNAKYSLHHPAVMGTGVYMDESGTIDMQDADGRKQDVRFDSSLAWVWWPDKSGAMAECIDARTGFAYGYDNHRRHECEREAEGKLDSSGGALALSMVSTTELVRLFLQLTSSENEQATMIETLPQLRAFKRAASPEYEMAKNELLSEHRVFRHWRRREREYHYANSTSTC